jgi:hypothetical protein
VVLKARAFKNDQNYGLWNLNLLYHDYGSLRIIVKIHLLHSALDKGDQIAVPLPYAVKTLDDEIQITYPDKVLEITYPDKVLRSLTHISYLPCSTSTLCYQYFGR